MDNKFKKTGIQSSPIVKDIITEVRLGRAQSLFERLSNTVDSIFDIVTTDPKIGITNNQANSIRNLKIKK